MKARKKYDAVATIGTYKDRTTGEDKKRYATVGTVFESEDGRLSLKLDTIPICPGWSGFVSFYEPRNEAGGRPVQRSLPPAPAQAVESQSDDDDGDIPF